MTICSMSKAVLARPTGVFLQLLPDCWAGEGTGQAPLTTLPSPCIPPVAAPCGTCREPGWAQQAGKAGKASARLLPTPD